MTTSSLRVFRLVREQTKQFLFRFVQVVFGSSIRVSQSNSESLLFRINGYNFLVCGHFKLSSVLLFVCRGPTQQFLFFFALFGAFVDLCSDNVCGASRR